MTGYIIGIDIGTTGTKVVLLDPERGIIAEQSAATRLSSPRAGMAEADPNEWLNNVSSTVPRLLSSAGIAPHHVAAVATTGMVPALVLTSADGTALRPAILQNDARATQQIDELQRAYEGVDVVSATGSALTQQSIAPTLLWIQEHEPSVWGEARFAMGSYDWILHALGAAAHVEQNWAMESGLFTIDGEFFAPALQHARIDPRLIPPVHRPGDIVGTLSADGARLLGLVEGIALVVGGADHVLSAYAAGVDREGTFLVKLGGAGDILAATSSPVVDPRLYLDAHPVEGLWLPNGCMATSGSLVRWLQAILGGAELSDLDQEAAERPAASLLCLPYFLGEKSPLHDPDLRGAFVGLHLGHTHADLYRAALESIAFGFRHHFEVFKSIGIPVTQVMVTNGGSKSVLWKKIHADVLGLPLFPVLGHPGASMGAAIIGAIAVGELRDWSAARRFLRLGEVILPDSRTSDDYTEAYQIWRDAGAALTPISHQLARRATS